MEVDEDRRSPSVFLRWPRRTMAPKSAFTDLGT
jgi:hypothetical protein